MKYYSEEHILELEKHKKSILLFSIFEIVSVFIFVGISFIFVSLENKIIFKIMDSIILSLGSVIFVYTLLVCYFPCVHLIDHIDEITYSNSEIKECELYEIVKEKTYSKDIVVIEIKVNIDGNIKNIYLNKNFTTLDFSVGKKYKILISNNFIKEIFKNEN